MQKHICISTGSFHHHFEGRDYHSRLKKCMELDGVEGVELLFDEANHLMNFKLTKDEIDFLSELKFNTIHAPFYITHDGKHADYRDNPFYRKLMGRLHNIYDKVGAKNINVHPEEISDYSIFRNKDYQYTIENSPPKYGYGISFYRKIIECNPHFKMVLDVSRAMQADELNMLIKNFKKYIMYCHMSAYHNKKPHIFLHNLDSEVLKKLEPLKKLGTAFISETSQKHTIDFYQKEIDFLKKWLGS